MYQDNRNVSTTNTNNALELTPEEKKIYKDCCSDGFFKTCVPWTTFTTLGAFTVLKLGILKSSTSFSFGGTLSVAGGLGFMIGSFLNKTSCMQKLLDDPRSNLKQRYEAALRTHQQNVGIQKGQIMPELHNETEIPIVSNLQTDDYQSPNDFDGFSGVNTDIDHPYDDFYTMEPLNKFGGTSTTYDELRQKNREEYTKLRYPRQPNRFDGARPAPEPAPMFEPSTFSNEYDRVPQYQFND